MNRFSLGQMAEVLNLPQPPMDAAFTDIAYDSRQVEVGDLFIATAGERADGHDFIRDVEQRGASALLISRPVQTNLPYLMVPDVIEAMGLFASHFRKQFSIPLIAVTGSNGKTTTKSMIASILIAASSAEMVLTTSKSHNTNITLPIHLLQMNRRHRWAVLELGMSHLGEVDYLSRMVRPTVAVITNALPSHLAGVGGTLKGVAQAKGEIFQGLTDNGMAVLNRDDRFYDYWKGLAGERKRLSFGLSSEAQVTAEAVELKQDESIFTLQSPFGNVPVRLPLMGKHNVRNALAATAACLAVGADLRAIQKGLETVTIAYQRLKIHHLRQGAIVIDDSYNANPASTQAAIEVLVKHRGKKILVLGDMKELGDREHLYHREVGDYARQEGVNVLFGFGGLSKNSVDAFGNDAQHFTTKQALLSALEPLLAEEVCILVKGSRSMMMEDIVKGLVDR